MKPTKTDETRCKRHTVSLEPKYWTVIQRYGGASYQLRELALSLLNREALLNIDIVSPRGEKGENDGP